MFILYPVRFFYTIKITKVKLISIIDNIIAKKKTPTITKPANLLPIFTFIISVPSLPSVCPLLLFGPSIHTNMWLERYSCWAVSRNHFVIRLPDTNILHFSKTICFSEWGTYPRLHLTSYSVCTHSSPNFHPSLMSFRDFLLSWYWY